ncbi:MULTISPECIES: restriction endonuclease subunit S [Enterobacteriaceae]|nr:MULTISPECIES: restriction endonuclease subunit S [Enterobacteriaceae]WCS70543.1 Type I restriction-modification system, specificity subunit S [Enterobacter hormaechei]
MSEMSYLEKLLDGAEVEWKPLREVCDFKNGFAFKSNLFKETGFPIVRITNIDGFNVNLDEVKYFSPNDYKEDISSFEVSMGDIVIAMSGATTGKVGFYKNETRCYLNQRVGKFVPKRNLLNNKYLYHFLLLNTEAIYILAGGGAQPNLSSNALMSKLLIPIPSSSNPEKSLAIQSEIARILDKFTALTAELTAELTARKKQYNYYRDQLLSFDEEQEKPIYLEKLLDGVEVEWKSLGEVAEIYGGLTGKTKADFEKGNARYISYKKIFGSLDIKNMPTDYVHVREDERQHEVRYGDILFTGSSEIAEEAGISCAVTSQFDEPVYLNSFSFGVRFNNKIKLIPEFLKYLFRTNKMRKEISKTASGVTRFNISKARFKKILIPILCPNNPEKSLAIQSEIVRILDKFDTLTNSITEGLPREIELRQKQYEYYRDLLFSFPKPDSVTN